MKRAKSIFLWCGECGCSITAEAITKRQKNGNVHRYVYYRCTKKRGPCSQSYVREEALNTQLSDLLSRFVLPQEWGKEMLLMADKDEREAQSVAVASVRELRATLADIDTRIARLTDLYVEQDIDRDAYLVRKRALMSERKSVEGQIAHLERNASAWLEPMRKWIQDAQMLDEILKNNDLPSKKTSLQKIFGSNLTLQSRETRGVAQNQWTALTAVHQKNSISSSVSTMVPGEGLEPSSSFEQRILSPARIPVPPPGHVLKGLDGSCLPAGDLYDTRVRGFVPLRGMSRRDTDLEYL